MLTESLNQLRTEASTNAPTNQEATDPLGNDIKIDNVSLSKNNEVLKELEARLNAIASYASL